VDRENFTIYFILFPVFYAQRITREGGGREREREGKACNGNETDTHSYTYTVSAVDDPYIRKQK